MRNNSVVSSGFFVMCTRVLFKVTFKHSIYIITQLITSNYEQKMKLDVVMKCQYLAFSFFLWTLL